MRKRRTMQWILLVVTLLLSILIVNRPVFATPVTVLSVPTVQDTSLVFGTVFSINITVADVEEMFGFQFILYFDPNVLMAVSYSSYFPFTEEWPSEIGFDYVAVAFAVLLGEPEGLTTVDPAPIVKIDFIVIGDGRSILYLDNTILSRMTDLGAEEITHEVRHAFFANIPPVEPGLDPSIYTSHPTNHGIGGGLTVTLPEEAYDGSDGTAAFFNYGSGFDVENYFQVTTFKIPSWVGTPPPIAQVDFKMNYSAQANPAGEEYQIEYYVDPSPNPIVLQIWTNETYETATREWLDTLEPNDATWTWTDVADIKFRVSASQVEGTSASSIFEEYEAWVEVTIAAAPLPAAELSVYPPIITEPYKAPGETFTINITATDFIDLWFYDFFLSYDTYVLTATSFSSYDPFTLSWPSEINDTAGYVSMAYNMPMGVSEGFWGTAPIANITFSVDYLGESALDLHDVALKDPFGPYPAVFTVQDGYFRNVDAASIPTASFTYQPPSPIEQQEITFNASLSTPDGGTIISWIWDFGDENSGTGEIATHTYAVAGEYPVNLTVIDDEGKWDDLIRIVKVYKHDIAVVSVVPSATHVVIGESVSIDVTVKNEGDFTETFDVTVYYNATEIDTLTVANLVAGASQTLAFTWDTTGVAEDTYIIKAEASPVPAEADLADNVLIDEEVTVSTVPVVHDIAITSVTASPTTVRPGELVSIAVALKNEGTEPETFAVTVYYDAVVIGTQTVTNLAPNVSQTLGFSWDTTDVMEDQYILGAVAETVPGEIDIEDNTYEDGTVTVATAPPPVSVTVRIEPETLNLRSKGKWITCFIQLSEGYSVEDIDVSTILLENIIPAEWTSVLEENVLVVKFDRAAVIQYIQQVLNITSGDVSLKITATLTDETPLERSATIRVISKISKKTRI